MDVSLVWQDGYKVGIEQIDTEHQHLISLIVRFYKAVQEGKARQMTTELITNLIDYTKTHFRNEEDLMKNHSYPDFEIHKNDHEKFIKEVIEATQTYMQGGVLPSNKVLSFLANWLVDHILNHDKKMGLYLKTHHAVE